MWIFTSCFCSYLFRLFAALMLEFTAQDLDLFMETAWKDSYRSGSLYLALLPKPHFRETHSIVCMCICTHIWNICMLVSTLPYIIICLILLLLYKCSKFRCHQNSRSLKLVLRTLLLVMIHWLPLMLITAQTGHTARYKM